MAKNMLGIRHIILVLSGKGGVGKSTVSSQLAFLLMRQGKRVGLLDIDLTGPSIPKIVGLEKHSVHQSSQGWVPVYLDDKKQLACMSIGFLLDDKDSAVVWRGPKKNAIIKQFMEDVCWGELDYLVIDTPPGTSDEHITVAEQLSKYRVDGAVVVTTPQGVSTSDVRREISFCRKVGFSILGLVENMSGFVCPTCKECTLIFSKGGGELLAKEQQIPFIGCVPIDPAIAQSCDEGRSFVERFSGSESLLALEGFVKKLVAEDSSHIKTHA